MRVTRRHLLASALALAFAVATSAAVTLRWSWNRLTTPFHDYSGEEQIVTIETGLSGEQIINDLAAKGIIRDPRLCQLYLRFGLAGEPLKAGEYRFHGRLSAVEVLDILVEARVLTHQITIIEGSTLEETAQALAEADFGSVDAFLEAMRSPALISDLDDKATDLEGYLFPDTYAFTSAASEVQIVEAIVAHGRRKLQPIIDDLIESEARETLREIVTLASIVEKEARLDSERPVIAGVYANRLESGMGLYADPTVIYALKQLGRWNGNLRRSDLEVESPYNTYRYRGLPPGPIASPGLASLEAAAHPADVPFFFFVSRNDGSHVFARTLSEHNRNVQIWQKQYWRDRWAAERSVEESTDS